MLLLVAGALWIAAATCAQAKEKSEESHEGFGELTVDQVAAKLGQKDVFLFDNNPREDYAEGHVPGARWVDYKHVADKDLPPDKDATLIFYCANPH